MPDVPPDCYRTFYELPAFVRRWSALGLSEADRLSLMTELMADPDAGTVVPSAGGLRKMRFAPEGQGKSGAYRVYYAHLPDFGVVVLAIVFAKSEAADIPRAMRPVLADAVLNLETALRFRAETERNSDRQGGA